MNENRQLKFIGTLAFVSMMFVLWLIPKPMYAEVVPFCGFVVSPKDAEDEEKEKCKKCPSACKKSPCSVSKGNYSTSAMDLHIPTRGFPLVVNREYSTGKAIDGFFGYGWTSNLTSRLIYTVYLFAAPSTYMKLAVIVMPNGGVYKFTENADGSFTPPSGTFDTLVKNGDGSFDLTLELSRMRFHYNSQGSLTTMTNAYNSSLSFTYDGGTGRLSQITDATGSGRWLSFTYNPNGQIELIQDHTGRQIQYQYTSSKLMTVVDSENRETNYDYVDGRFAPLLTQIKDHWGRIITDVTYDAEDRVSTYTQAGEVYTYTYQYQNAANKTAKADSVGNTWVYTFNSDGQVTQTDPPGLGSASSTVNYNPDGTIQSTVDETGVVTSYTYNANGSIATVVRDNGGSQAVRLDYGYDTNFPEKVVSIIPKDPITGQLNLDWQGQKFDYYQAGSTAPGALFHIYRVRNNGSTLDTLVTYSHNAAGQVLNVTSATGGVTTYGYDATTGDLTSITQPKNSIAGLNPTFAYARDPLGRVSSITNPLGKITSFTYDNLDRILTVTAPKPQPLSPDFVTTYTYDQYDMTSGLLFSEIGDVNDRITKHGSDQYGHLNKSIDALNNITIFVYNLGLLASITDANGNQTSYTYNGLRQLTATTYPEGTSETYTYWEDGHLKSKTDRNGQTINYEYDHLKRLTLKGYPDATSIIFSFTGQKLTTVTDTSANETHSYSYDTSYRVSSDTQGPRGTITYTYSSADNIASYSVSGGGPTATYTYYDDGNLKTIVWSPVTGTFTYNYTLNGQYSSIDLPNTQVRSFTYDDQGRLTQIVNSRPTPGNLATYSYGYDVNYAGGIETMLGQRTSLTSTVPSQGFSSHQTKYYYDANYQLTRVDYPNVVPFGVEVDQWDYDPIGNRLFNQINGAPQNYTYLPNSIGNNSQRLQSDGINNYDYDLNGNMISMSGPGGNFTFGYDFENRLISISGSTVASYKYDYKGRRISKTLGSTTTYIYDGSDLIAERGASVADFVIGSRIDEPLAMRRSSVTYYFDIDALGSVNLVNDSNGSILDKYVFDAWGITRSQTAPVLNPFGYTSREFAEVGAVYFRARHLRPGIGRFNGPDMLGWKVGINVYAYVRNDPISFIDPLGLRLCKLNGPGRKGQEEIIIDESIAPQIESLISSAQAAGIPLQITKYFRTSQEQSKIYSSNNPYPVALPSTSNHEVGTAIDFNTKNLSNRQLKQLETIALSLGLRHPSNDKVHFDNSMTFRVDFYNFQELYLENQRQFNSTDLRDAIDWCNTRCSVEEEPIVKME